MAAKFGARSSVQVARSGMSNSSTASSAESFIPYEGKEKLKIWNLDVENDPGWMLRNHPNDALHHGGDMSLRRSIVEYIQLTASINIINWDGIWRVQGINSWFGRSPNLIHAHQILQKQTVPCKQKAPVFIPIF